MFHVWSFFLFHLPLLTFDISIFPPLSFLFCLSNLNIPFFSLPISLFSFISDHITPLILSPFYLTPILRSSFQLLHFILSSFHFFFSSKLEFFYPFTSHFHSSTISVFQLLPFIPSPLSFLSSLSCLHLLRFFISSILATPFYTSSTSSRYFCRKSTLCSLCQCQK